MSVSAGLWPRGFLVLALIFVDDLTVGMVLAEDLFTPKGRLVLASGVALERPHLEILKTWGIYEVQIVEESLGEDYLRKQEQTAEQTERAEAYLWRRFALNDLEQEPIATIFRHAVRRFSESLEKGWDPVRLLVEQGEDLEEDFNPLSVPQLLSGNTELVSLPTVYSHIVAALNDQASSAQKIAEAVSKDASLTVRLLRLVNSPIYGFPGKIDSISRAVSLVGTNEISALALGVTVVRQFDKIPSELLDMNSFWRHSIHCGLFAKELAVHLGEQGTEKYFTGGLLHDIGRLIMLERMPKQYGRAVAYGRREHLPMYRAEQDCLQTDHSILGKLLTMRWRLPPELIRMISGHHSPSANHYALESSLMHVADVLAHALGHEVNLVNEVPPLQGKAWQETGLTEEALAPVIRKVDAEFADIVRVFFGESTP